MHPLTVLFCLYYFKNQFRTIIPLSDNTWHFILTIAFMHNAHAVSIFFDLEHMLQDGNMYASLQYSSI